MSPSRTPSRTPSRRVGGEQRRASILEAARARYASAAYDAVAVADVAAQAGVSEALVFHYFGSKAGLYAEVVRTSCDALVTAQHEAVAALPAGAPARERVRAVLDALLDDVAGSPPAAAAVLPDGTEPIEAVRVRARARTQQTGLLAALVGTCGWARHEYAVAGALGFVDSAVRRWVDRGCPADERGPLVDAALGALEGALGDWAG